MVEGGGEASPNGDLDTLGVPTNKQQVEENMIGTGGVGYMIALRQSERLESVKFAHETLRAPAWVFLDCRGSMLLQESLNARRFYLAKAFMLSTR